MPIYHFDVEIRGMLTKDREGRTLDDDEAARAHAEAVLDAIARETAGSVSVYARREGGRAGEDGPVVGVKALVRVG